MTTVHGLISILKMVNKYTAFNPPCAAGEVFYIQISKAIHLFRSFYTNARDFYTAFDRRLIIALFLFSLVECQDTRVERNILSIKLTSMKFIFHVRKSRLGY